MHNDETNKDLNATIETRAHISVNPVNEEPEPEEIAKGGWRETFRTAFDRARRQQKPVENRQELSRDRSKSLLVLAIVAVVLLLVFFGLFSSPKKRAPLPGENTRGHASLGRKVTPAQEGSDSGKNVAPMLSADVRSSDPAVAGQVTPEEVGRTSRNGYTATHASINPAMTKTNLPQDYALSRVDFSDPLVGHGNTIPSSPPVPNGDQPRTPNQSSDLKKPSLVFVRSTIAKPVITSHASEDQEETLALPAGTRLVARLETSISSAVSVPAVAVIEYNYERNGQIVLPAGAKVFGRLAQVNPSGYVGIQFSRVEMPDGTTAKIEASAIDLNLGPLRGYVSGKKTVTKFLVRSLTGLGTVASYLVGPQASNSAGLISSNTLMRERLADNVGTAGQEQLNGLAFNQNLLVTVPGNTRFYIVLQKPTADYTDSPNATRNASPSTAGFSGMPTMEELRQLLQLRREINQLYTQTSQAVPQPQQQ